MSDDPEEPKSAKSSKHRRFAEQRILVLHNADFAETPDGDPAYESRADVLNQAHDVARALATRGHFVDLLGIDREDVPALLSRLQNDPPDLVFNLVESLVKIDAHQVVTPALLALFDVPFTGASAATMLLAGDKMRTKQVLAAEGIPTPRGVLLSGPFRSSVADLSSIARLGYPLIAKFPDESGSFGLTPHSVVNSDDSLLAHLRVLRETYPLRRILVEQYIEGRELNVSLLGHRVLPIAEIDMSRLPDGQPRIVTYDAKWNKTSADYALVSSSRTATDLAQPVAEKIKQVAERAFAALGMCDYGRVDFRLSSDGTPYVLEVNANCDLSDGAGLSLAARSVGIPYDELVEEVAQSARRRFATARAALPD